MTQNLFVIYGILSLLLLTNLHRFEKFWTPSSSNKMTFYYFAYGSNLLAKRIHINNPSAMRVDIGKLENYRLDFIGYSDKWRGAVATVVPTDNRTVWGSIWRIDRKDMKHLDQQEGVDEGIYRVMEHCIERQNGSMLLCRMYQHCLMPSDEPVKIAALPRERMPSTSYVDTIREGARESQLPDDYIKFLFAIPDNGNSTSLDNLMEVAPGSECTETEVA